MEFHKINLENIPTAIPVEITIEVTHDEVQKVMDDTWDQIKDSMNMKGFRKGKVPRKVVEEKFSILQLYSNAIIAAFDAKILNEYHPVHGPVLLNFDRQLSPGKEGKNWVYTTSLFFAPEVTIDDELVKLIKSDEFEVKVPKMNVENLVEVFAQKRLQDLRDDHQKLEPEEGPIEDGDVIILDCTTHFVENNSVWKEGTFKKHKVMISPEAIRPAEVYEALKKTAKRQPTVVNYVMSKEQSEVWAGKEMSATFIVKEIMNSKDPEVDDDLAMSANYPGKEAMVDSIKAFAKEQVEANKKGMLEQAVIFQALRYCKLGPIPQAWMEARLSQAWQEGLSKLGGDEEAVFKYLNVKDKSGAYDHLTKVLGNNICRELSIRAIGLDVLGVECEDLSLDAMAQYIEIVMEEFVKRAKFVEVEPVVDERGNKSDSTENPGDQGGVPITAGLDDASETNGEAANRPS
jgi:trigger factor